jgi:hypothetical protein
MGEANRRKASKNYTDNRSLVVMGGLDARN